MLEQKIPIPLEAIPKKPRPDFDSPLKTMTATVASALQQDIDALPPQEFKKIVSVTHEVPIGTICTHSGCNKAYESSATNETNCIYHSGVPIFHEGMKYWSCCQRKTSDFTAFMNQEGCEHGQHKWIKDDADTNVVKCRWDWHQTAKNVVVSVYAKMYDYKRSVVKMNPIRLCIDLVFPQQNDNRFIIDLELRGVSFLHNFQGTA